MSLRANKHVEGKLVSTDSASQTPAPHNLDSSSSKISSYTPPFPIGDPSSFPKFEARALKTPPVAGADLHRLISDLSGTSLYRGSACFTPDSVPVVMMSAPDAAVFHAFRKGHVTVSIWCWDTPFGNLLSVSAGNETTPVPARTFMTMDDPVYQAACATRQIAIAVYYGENVSKFVVADFDAEPQRYKGLVALKTFPFDVTFLYQDFELAYWWLMARPKMKWSASLANRPKERLQAGWAYWAARLVQNFLELLTMHRENNALDSPTSTELFAACRDEFPYLYPLLKAIDGTASLKDVLTIAGHSLSTAEAAEDMLGALTVSEQSGYGNHSVLHVAHRALRTSWYVHESNRAGMRRPWFDIRSMPMRPRYIDLDPIALGPGVQDYWRYVELENPVNEGLFITGRDVPVDAREIMESLGTLEFHEYTADQAKARTQSVLAEAVEHRQWTVPWGARVQVGLDIFKYADLYEVGSEFYCVLRDANERYLVTTANTRTGIIKVPNLYSVIGEAPKRHEDAMAIVGLILAGIIRDFLVVENRQNVFGQRPRKHLGMAGSTMHPGLAVVYLPRVRYDRPLGIRQTADMFSKFKPKAAHLVSGHLRKSSTASAAQIVLAHRTGIFVPAGFTFVRPHQRGLLAGDEVKREYRSRSATQTLFAAAAGRNKRNAEWFDFERNIANFVKSLGLTTEQTTSSASDSHGIDIFAFNNLTNEIMMIRCLYFPQWRKVGSDMVRDVADSLHRYPHGTKGMIVTTSDYTQEAIDEAEHHEFTLINGTTLKIRVQSRN